MCGKKGRRDGIVDENQPQGALRCTEDYEKMMPAREYPNANRRGDGAECGVDVRLTKKAGGMPTGLF